MKKKLDETSARQGFTTRHMTIVLGLSLVLAVVALGAVMGFF